MLAITIVTLASSCSTSNDVASNHVIQKRKYNKGFFVSKNTKNFDKKNKTEHTKQIVVTEKMAEVISELPEALKKEEINKNVNFEENKIANKETKPLSKNKQAKFNDNTSKKNNNISQIIKENSVQYNYNSFTKKNINKIKHKTNINYLVSGDEMLILLVILAFLIPFVAVGIKTDWDVKKVVIALILSILFWVPGIIYALLVVFDMI